MAYDMIKYERGQIWKIRFKNSYEQRGREQQKDRPWLILSVGKFNTSAGMVTAVPITTRDKAVTVAQVLFQNSQGINNVIMCEHIRTFDYNSGDYIFEYMGQLSDKVLEKVDVALSVHLGMHYSPVTLNSLYNSMEAVVKSIGYLEKSEKFTDEDVERFANKLKKIAMNAESKSTEIEDRSPEGDIVEVKRTLEELHPNSKENDKKETTPTELSEEHPQIKKFYKRFAMKDAPENSVAPKPFKDFQKPPAPTSEKSSTSVEEPPKKSRMKWTPDKCKEFMEDSKNLPMKETMKKWGIETPNRYYVMRNYVQNILLKLQRAD